MGICDVAIGNEAFARRLAAQYEDDLHGATEIVLSANRPQRVVDRTSREPAAPDG